MKRAGYMLLIMALVIPLTRAVWWQSSGATKPAEARPAALSEVWPAGVKFERLPDVGSPTKMTAPTLALTSNITWTSGTGAPSSGNRTSAKVGSIYSRTDGTGTTDALYVCTNNGGSPVWTAK